MAYEAAQLERLGKAVRSRRVELGLSVIGAARRVKMSKDTWKRVEGGLAVRDTTYGGIDTALEWAAGSCVAVLSGGESTLANAAVKITRAPLPDDEDVRQVVQGALIATLPEVTGREISSATDTVIDALRSRRILAPREDDPK